MEAKYRILLAQFVTPDGRKFSIPYGEGFGVNDIEAYRRKFKMESRCSGLRLTYEEKLN